MFGAAPLPDPAEVDGRIAAATAALAALPPGTPEHRAARVELATFLFARYTAAGDDADRAAVAATCRDVLADPGATARERQAVGLIQPVLTMLALFRPGAAPPRPPTTWPAACGRWPPRPKPCPVPPSCPRRCAG